MKHRLIKNLSSEIRKTSLEKFVKKRWNLIIATKKEIKLKIKNKFWNSTTELVKENYNLCEKYKIFTIIKNNKY